MSHAPPAMPYRDALATVEPAARVVPTRVLRRVIRRSRDRGTFRPHPVHDRSWWVGRDRLFELLDPHELGLSPTEPAAELLLIPAPPPDTPPSHTDIWRTLFHAAIDRELDAARRTGRLDGETIRRARRAVGSVRWQTIRMVLREENLIDDSDPDDAAFCEFVAFALEIRQFRPDDWDTFFPDLPDDAEPLRTADQLLDIGAIYQRTRPPGGPTGLVPPAAQSPATEAAPPGPPPDPGRVAGWAGRGNDLKAAVLLARAGDPRAETHLDRLAGRLAAILDFDADERQQWRAAMRPLLGRAAAGGWPVERRLLYEIQRACLAVERTSYAVNLFEWIRSFGRRRLKRPLPKTRWVNAERRLRAARKYAEQTPLAGPLPGLLGDATHAAETRARNKLRPVIVAVLDEVGLTPVSVPERRSQAKLVEELLDVAGVRGFLRIGDLRDAIARSRLKLPDLRGPGELVLGDPLIKADERLGVRLDGVYRRGEIYMRLLQRGCSVFFGTRAGRWLSLFVALPFGGAFLLLEAFNHLYEAVVEALHWLTGHSAAVAGVGFLGGAPAGLVAEHPTLDPGGVSWEAVIGVGLFLLLLIHWPAFRARVGWLVSLTFVKLPRAVRRSPVVQALVHNPVTRFFRRFLLVPTAAGGAAALATAMVGGGPVSVALAGGGVALLAGTFARTSLGREMEDRLDEVMERLWRILSVNFFVGMLGLILQFFQAVFEVIDRAIYAVDEALRFHEGQGRGVFAIKLVAGAGWFTFAYLFRFAWTLLVEPQINPVKHFPVVTVSHKVLLPLVPSLAKQLAVSEKSMLVSVSAIPGIFGFLVWELKENWKLYRANAADDIEPVPVGSHGETFRGLLRPGFHSGTVPKAFAKLRRAVRAGDSPRVRKLRHAIHHVAEDVERFAARTFLAELRASRRWGNPDVRLGEPVLGPNRIVLVLEVGHGGEPIRAAIEERNGWVIGSVVEPGALRDTGPEARAAFADSLLGLYKRAGVHVVREQVAAVFGEQASDFDAVPEGLLIPVADGTERLFDYEDGPEIDGADRRLPGERVVLSEQPVRWDDWVARWEADAAGKAPLEPLIPGWTLLPPTARG